MAYFAEIEENARNAVDLMDGGERDNFLSWVSSSLLANAGTADVAEAELTTAETDSDISMKEGLVMQLERLAAIPAVSLKPNSLQSELVISRIPTTGAAPISFCLPKVAWMKCMHEMDAIIQESRKILSGHTAEEADLWSTELKKKWWSTRKLLDERIEKAVLCMQETLGFWRCLLVKNTNMYSGQVVQSCWNILASSKLGSIRLAERNLTLLSAVTDAQYWLSDSEVIDALHHIAAEIEAPMPDSIAQEILQLIRSAGQHSTEAIDSGHVSNLSKLSTERIAKLKVSEVKQLLVTEGLSTDGLKKVLVGRLIAARDAALLEELTLQARGGSQECSTILILNHQLQQFPWEGMDVMGSSTGVTRMPSLDLILQNAGRASPVTRVRRNRVRFLLNPAGDLKSTQNQLGPILEGGTTTYGWEGVVGEIPDPDELREYLLAADLYIYCGHGSGEAYLHRDKVMSLQSDCSAALLFGCSSGRLERQGIFGPSGAVLAYLRAGSPAVLAMLWDVTDRDIDQLSVKVLQEWLLADPEDESDSRSLAQVLQGSRGVCKLKYLNGHAAVCYGLPLHVTKC
ncbi:hypothetical protein KRP22_010721 [Phytophthora ramorum]|nr:Separin [Phytophthora ramorum]